MKNEYQNAYPHAAQIRAALDAGLVVVVRGDTRYDTCYTMVGAYPNANVARFAADAIETDGEVDVYVIDPAVDGSWRTFNIAAGLSTAAYLHGEGSYHQATQPGPASFREAVQANADLWVPANAGSETPYVHPEIGRRVLWCYNPKQRRHAYICCDTDMEWHEGDRGWELRGSNAFRLHGEVL